jgi:hypothetical protein
MANSEFNYIKNNKSHESFMIAMVVGLFLLYLMSKLQTLSNVTLDDYAGTRWSK